VEKLKITRKIDSADSRVIGGNMLEKVKEIIEKEIRPALAMDSGSVELLNVEDGTVKVRLGGSCAGCPMSQYTVKNFVESTIKR
jgi:Fe-S cluster biogenesis protein NfuA